MPIGTLIQKIQCQEMPSTTAPPTSGPIATARPEMPDQRPSTSPRRPAGKASESSVSVSGSTAAAAAPWIARAAISAAVVGASAAAAEATVNAETPMTNMRLRPKRSPSAAPVSSSTAKVSVYALTVHCRDSIVAPRSARMLGSAVVTTRLSRTTMKSAVDTTANVHLGRMREAPCERSLTMGSEYVLTIAIRQAPASEPRERWIDVPDAHQSTARVALRVGRRVSRPREPRRSPPSASRGRRRTPPARCR